MDHALAANNSPNLLFLFLALLLIGQIIWPKAMWKITEAWKYKDPDLHEPSRLRYIVSAIVAAVVLAGLALAWLWPPPLPPLS